MNKSMFSGWRHVFSFTFKQGTESNRFKAVTIGMALLLLLGGMSISIIMAFVQKSDAEEVSPIEVVHVIDETGLDVLYLDGFMEAYKDKYPTISFKEATGTVEQVWDGLEKAAVGEEPDENAAEPDMILHLTKEEKGYAMSLYMQETASLSEGDGKDFLDDLMLVMEQSKLFSSGIGMEKLIYVMSGVNWTMLDAGEQEKSVGEELVGLLLPMILMFFIYIMNLVYGMSIGNVVSSEKTSKLMEMILTLTKPYGLIFGKIFAMASIAIMQMFLWIACFVGGFIAGDFVAKEMVYPEYTNVIMEVFELIGNQDGSTAFTAGAFILSIVTVCIGFLFYCVIAGTCASFATKAEELGQVMGIYQMIMIAGFFGAYMLPSMQRNESINTILRIVPITSAYLLPGDVVVGNVSIGLGCLYFGILLLTTLVLLVIAGKVYKNQMFYRGKSILDRFKKKKKEK